MVGNNLYYDKEGNPIDLERWSELQSDLDYKIIAQEYLGPLFISTIWFGINTNFFGPPMVFETMVFHATGILKQQRYITEDQARQGHAETVKEFKEYENRRN